ncbi:MAG TPA: hypothetical protein VNS60_04275 [Solirubrobacterales bacterium]|nr:hypothetical protein [Solirubrobacterales bacterium]
MRAGWFKIGVVVAVSALVVAGYLVGKSTTDSGERSQGHPLIDRRSLTGQAEAIRDALSGAGQVTTLKAERCPTQAVGGGYVRPPSKVRVRVPAPSISHLVVFAATNGILLPAPAKWECTASIGADGSEEIGAGPIGSVTTKGTGAFPQLRRYGPAVKATLIPACEGCIATAICSFFPHAAVTKVYESEQLCKGRPKGELRFRLSHSTYMFVDPPDVDSSSTGSGGSLPSVGVLSYSPIAGVRQLVCTVAASEVDTCTEAIVAFIAFGHRR